MNVTVKLFAAARELAGAVEVVVELPDGGTVGRLCVVLAAQHPALAGIVANSLMAVYAEYAAESVVVAAGDEVALIPPVSGG